MVILIKKTIIFLILISSFAAFSAQRLYGQIEIGKPLEVPIFYGENKKFKGHVKVFFQYHEKSKEGIGTGILITNYDLAELKFDKLEYGNFKVRIDEIKFQRGNHTNKFKLVIPSSASCMGGGEGIKPLRSSSNPVEVRFGGNGRPLGSREDHIIAYKVTQNLAGRFVMNIGIVPNEINYDDWTCDNGKITIGYRVSGIKPPPEKPKLTDPDSPFWAENRKKGLSGLACLSGKIS